MKEFITELPLQEGKFAISTGDTLYFGQLYHGYKLLIHQQENTAQMRDHAEGLADDYLPVHHTKLKLAEVYCYRWWLFYRYKGQMRYHIDYFNCHSSTNTLNAMERLIRKEQALNP